MSDYETIGVSELCSMYVLNHCGHLLVAFVLSWWCHLVLLWICLVTQRDANAGIDYWSLVYIIIIIDIICSIGCLCQLIMIKCQSWIMCCNWMRLVLSMSYIILGRKMLFSNWPVAALTLYRVRHVVIKWGDVQLVCACSANEISHPAIILSLLVLCYWPMKVVLVSRWNWFSSVFACVFHNIQLQNCASGLWSCHSKMAGVAQLCFCYILKIVRTGCMRLKFLHTWIIASRESWNISEDCQERFITRSSNSAVETSFPWIRTELMRLCAYLHPLNGFKVRGHVHQRQL